MEEINFARVTACGECCDGCGKFKEGSCPGCIEADGDVPEWKESGGCSIHKCARRHGVRFCGLCGEFPCTWLKEKIVWNPHAVEHLAELAEAWRNAHIEKE